MTTYRERHLAGVHDAKKQAAKAEKEAEKQAAKDAKK